MKASWLFFIVLIITRQVLMFMLGFGVITWEEFCFYILSDTIYLGLIMIFLAIKEGQE